MPTNAGGRMRRRGGKFLTVPMLKETQEAASAPGLCVQVIEVHIPNDFDSAFTTVKKEHVGALNVLNSAVFNVHRKTLCSTP
jgi:hypothetical protein